MMSKKETCDACYYTNSETAVNPDLIARQCIWSGIIKNILNKGYLEEVVDLIYKM